MASFQVEITAPSPFACAAVHNRRDHPFQNNLNNLDITDLWVHQPQWQAAPDTNNNAPCEPRNSYASDGETSATAANADAEPNKPKDNWARAREIVFPANTTPPKHSNSVDVSNAGGVSSLVQKWKGFEAGAKRPPPPPPPPGASAIIYDDDSVIGDWESDRTVLSGRSSMRGRDSDATESERLRVVDIIRKLTPNETGSVSPPRSRSSLDQADLRSVLPPVPGPRVRTSLDHQELPRCLPTVGCAPRIRGRQAYIDLLVQAERDRRNELQGLVTRKPVSTFSHRGRIQAALKIKLLRRGMETKEAHVHFRERVNIKAVNGGMKSGSRRQDNTPNSNSVHQNQNGAKSCLGAPNYHHHVTDSDSQHCIPPSKQEDISQENNTNVNFLEEFHNAETSFISQENNWESSTTKSADNAEAAPKFLDRNDDTKEDEEARAANYEANHHIVETTAYWVSSDASHTEEGWEEFHYDDDQANEANNTDWIEEVSRPRSDWEYLRQERYHEMLDPFLDNEDIRLLLGRKSVSSFLSSGMRDKIDQLMISRTTQGKPTQSIYNLRQDKRQEQVTEKGRDVLASGAGADEEFGEYFHEYEEAESSQHYTECDDFTDSTSNSWSQNQSQNQNQNQGGHESSECSYQAVSPSSRNIKRKSSFNARPSSIEMDLIYDLRRHMEQVHQEISELRKSIQCSTDMQIKLHRSIKKEVAAALNHHQDTKSGRRHPVKKATGRRCCVCSKLQIDCVLYKCGHMCTCFDCAQELHWNSGSCPICRAQIVDVIRTHSN